MRENKFNFSSSLIVGILTALCGDAGAAIRVGNLSHNYAGTTKNKLAVQQQYYNSVEPQQTSQDLPIPVADTKLAEQIASGDATSKTSVATLNRCAMILPEGEFVWDIPTLGHGAGGAPTCVAVVEMRKLSASGSLEYTTVARGKLAAGDMLHCNISNFPATSYLPAISQVEFPADNRPTRDDVVRVMNEEQKNKAGLKIAAAALAAGLAGNIVGKSDKNSDSLLGTNSEKLKSTAGGMLLGAGLMTASTYSGKVAGDMILHAGVNAAAGGVVGNMLSSNNSVLRIEKCSYQGRQTSCLWGNYVTTKTKDSATYKQVFYNKTTKDLVGCEKLESGDSYKDCKKLYNHKVLSITNNTESKTDFDDPNFDWDVLDKYDYDSTNNTVSKTTSGSYYVAQSAEIGTTTPVVVIGVQDSTFGMKRTDWDAWKKAHEDDITICRRDNKGEPTGDCTDYEITNFSPIEIKASDGDVVDISNKARLGSTLKGAGVGGAIGGFTGYQGAQNDIEDRLIQATREYNASLETFYCGTGRKFLSFYNDDAIIPEMNE